MSSVQPISEPKYGLKKKYENYIGGQWVAPTDGEYFENISPVNGKPMTRVPRSQAADIERALDAAHEAAPAWGKTSVTERSSILLKIADRMEENLEMLATVETWDNGKAIRETMAADLPLAIDHFRYFAGVIRAEAGEVSNIDANTVTMEVHEPLGVVGQIIPWNFPILMATWKLAPALAAGNCVVLKPAEQTPASILVLLELIEDLLPPGVINIVNGFGPEAGKPLASSPRIGKIAFTGETTTGRLIMQYASENIIPVTLELGGKSPNVVLDDAPLEAAVATGITVCFLNGGQSCSVATRLIVPRSKLEEVVEIARNAAESYVIGDPIEETTTLGPMVNAKQWAHIQGLIQSGIDEGARLVTGGTGKPAGHEKGYFVRPTVFADVEPGMRIAQEEIFGPVLSIQAYDTEEEAVWLANNTVYGRIEVHVANGATVSEVLRELRCGRTHPIAPGEVCGGRRHGHGVPRLFPGGIL